MAITYSTMSKNLINTKEFREKYSRLREVLLWYWHDAIIRYKKSISQTVITHIINLLSNLGSIGLIFYYIKALEKNRIVDLYYIQFTPKSSIILLILVAFGAFILYVASGLAEYSSKQKSYEMWRKYEELCHKRILSLISRIPFPGCLVANRLIADKDLSKDGKSESRQCGRFLYLIINAIVPILTTIVFFCVMMYISIMFSLMVFVLSFLLLFFIYKSSSDVAIAHDSNLLQKSSTSERSKLSKRINKSSLYINDDDNYLNKIYSSGEMGKHQTSYFGRFILQEKSRLIFNIFSGVSIIIIMLIAGIGIIYEKFNWSVFFAFIVSLRQFQSNSNQVANAFTNLGRMYPAVYKYYMFYSDAKIAFQYDIKDSNIPDQILFKIPNLADKNKFLKIKSGDFIYLVHQENVNRNTIAMLQNNNSGNKSKMPTYWFIGNVDLEGMTLREIYGFNKLIDNDAINRDLKKISESMNVFEPTDLDLDQVLTPDDLSRFSDEFIDCIKLLSAKHTSRITEL